MASGLALLAIVFMIVYVSKTRNSGSDVGKGLVSVLFAARDISAGTPGSALQSGALVKKRVPSASVVPGSITSPRQIRGAVATQETLAGEQITRRRFGPLAAGGVLSQIRGAQRIVQLGGDKDQVLDGTLKAGDHVDVFATWNVPESCNTCHISGAIVRGALVVATSAELGSGSSNNDVPVQLRLTDSQAKRVFWMTKNGDWWLVLRPVVKPRSGSAKLESARSIVDESGKGGR